MNMPNPAIAMSTADRGTEREKQKPTVPRPAAMAETPIHLASPRTDGRRARLTAEITAPRPTAPMKRPTSCAPSPKVFTAIAGMSDGVGADREAHRGEQEQHAADGQEAHGVAPAVGQVGERVGRARGPAAARTGRDAPRARASTAR